jgi:hypothetical protein
MARYHAKGSITLNCVDFYIIADNIEAARNKARNGEYDEYEIDASDVLDLDIKTATVGMD